MAYLFQVFVHRELTPEQGQEHLKYMAIEIAKNTQHYTPGAVRLAGVNRYENDFPEWLQQTLSKYGFTYDSINLCYYGRFNDEANAETWRWWFDEQIRPWAKAQGMNLDYIHSRTMTEHPEVDSLIAY